MQLAVWDQSQTVESREFISGFSGCAISEGVGFGILRPQLTALTAIGLAVMLVAVERFRKTVG